MAKDRNPEELARYLDELLQSSTLPSPNGVDDPLVEVALQLIQDKPPQLSADVQARMLKKVHRAHQSTLPVSNIKPKQIIRFPTQSILRWVAVFAIFIFLMNNVAVPAMAASLPGDILYPAKLAIESVELGLATSNTSRAEVYILHAERRLDEANKLLDSNTVNEQLITQAFDNIDRVNQLQLTSPIVQAQIASTWDEMDDLIERITEIEPTVANTLSQQLLTISPTKNSTLVVEESIPITEPTATFTPTATHTQTHTPIPTATFTEQPTATFTEQPTATHTLTPTDEPTVTLTPEPSPTSTEEPTPTETYESYVGVVSATTYVNIRTLPTTDSEIIRQVIPSTIVNVIGESLDGQWLKIIINDTHQGWIASSLIVEGTIPLFTLSSDAESEPTILPSVINPFDDTSIPSDTTTDTDTSSSQGNDDTNRFGCDGQGNSCNTDSQGNGNKDNKKK